MGWCKLQLLRHPTGECGLRDYSVAGQLGLEETPEEYFEHMVAIFREVRRVLRDDGVLWLNMGDCSATGSCGGGSVFANGRNDGRVTYESDKVRGREATRQKIIPPGLKPKDLCMMPARLAMALQAGFGQCTTCDLEQRMDLWPVRTGHRVCMECLIAGRLDSKIVRTEDGWYLRSVIPWLKRNCMPESCTDRPTNAIEYVFLLSKSARYYYDADAIRIPSHPETWGMKKDGSYSGKSVKDYKSAGVQDPSKLKAAMAKSEKSHTSRNFRNSDLFFKSWQGMLSDEDGDPLALVVNPKGYSEAHFATFPEKLVTPLILAGSGPKACEHCGAAWVSEVEKDNEVADENVSFSRRKDRTPDTDFTRRKKHPTCSSAMGTNIPGHSGHLKADGSPISPPVRITGHKPTCGCPDNDGHSRSIILDPFMGSGTTAYVARKHGRDWIGIDLSEDYKHLAERRLSQEVLEL